MAIIPRVRESTQMQVNAPVSIANPNEAREPGNDLAQLGQQFAQLGSQLVERDRTISREEGLSEMRNAAKEAEIYANKSAAKDGSDYGAKFNEYMEPRLSSIKDQYAGADPRLNNEFDSYIKRAQGDANVMITVRSTAMREQDSFNRVESLQDQSASRIYANSNPNLVQAEIQSNNLFIDDLIKSGGLSPTNAEKLKQAYYDKTSIALIKGLEERQQYGTALGLLTATEGKPGDANFSTAMDPRQARELGFITSQEAEQLTGEGKMYEIPVLTKGDKKPVSQGEAALMRGMDPLKKIGLIDNIKAKMKTNTEMRLGDLNANLQGFKEMALKGMPIADSQVENLKAQVNSNPNLTPFARVRNMSMIDSAYVVNKTLQTAQSTPRSQWGALLESAQNDIKARAANAAGRDPKMAAAEGDFAVQNIRAEAIQTLQNSLVSLRKEQDEDGAAFVQQDPRIQQLYRGAADAETSQEGRNAMQTYINYSLTKQQSLGISPTKQRVTTKSEASGIANQLALNPDAESTNQMLSSLEVRYGKYFPKVMEEVGAVNKDVANLGVATFANPSQRASLIDALKNEPAINEAWKKLPRADYQQNLISQSFRTGQLAELNKVFTDTSFNSSGISQVNNLQKAMELQVKRDLVRDPNANVEELSNKAYNDLVGSQYNIVQTSKTNLLVPKVINGKFVDERIVNNYVDTYTKAENFKDLGVAVPKNYAGKEDIYYKTLENDAMWTMNRDGTGVRLMGRGANGASGPVLDKYGAPIEKSFNDINLRPGQKVIDASKGFLGRMFGG